EVVITDLRMDQLDGLDVLAASQADDPARPVLIMTAYGSIDGAIEAVRQGAFHYFTKPFKLEEGVAWIERAPADLGRKREHKQLRQAVDERLGFRNLIGKSRLMVHVYELLERVSTIDSPVLVSGESGTGKELVAQALHFHGHRARGPFVAVNCAAISETLLE